MIPHLLYYLVSGSLVGLMSSVLGIGGGIIIIPVLILIFSLSQQEAIATSLITITLVSILNVSRFQRQRLISWRVVGFISLFSSISSMTAAYAAIRIPEKWLLIVFITFLIYLSIKTFLLKHRTVERQEVPHRFFRASLIGILSGFIAGFTGVGGGAITTPLLLTSRLATNKTVVPNSNGIMMFTAGFAALLFSQSISGEAEQIWKIGFIHLDAACFLFLGAIPSAYFGTKYQHHLSLTVKKSILGALLAVIAVRLLVNVFMP